MTKKNSEKRCPECGASMAERKILLNEGFAECLKKTAQAGGDRVDVRDLDLDRIQYGVFAKLAKFDLIQKEKNDDGTGRGGIWSLTPLGWQFVKGAAVSFLFIGTAAT